MKFLLNITLKEAKTIHSTQSSRVYLDVVLSKEDEKELKEMFSKNYDKDAAYVKTLYSVEPDAVNFSRTKFQIFMKVGRNRKYSEDTTKFTKLYYGVKLKDSNKIIGTFEMYSCGEEAVEFGIFIDKEYSHQGYGTEVLQTAIDFLKKHSTIEGVVWDCDRDNKSSVNLAKKCGFLHCFDDDLYEGRVASRYCLKLR